MPPLKSKLCFISKLTLTMKIPEFIKTRQRQREQPNIVANDRKQRITTFLSIYSAIIATLLSSYTAYNEFKPKTHNLEILISDIEVNNESAEYGIAFYNNGDYTEIISNAESILGQTIDGYEQQINWQQENCFTPIELKSGESTYVRYITKFEFSNIKHKMPSTLKQEYLMSVYLDILSEKQGIITQRIPVGILRPYQNNPAFKNKASLEFHTQKVQVNFESGRPKIIYGTYPQDSEFSFRTLCNKKT